jgi:RND superfamily putative drug exporter
VLVAVLVGGFVVLVAVTRGLVVPAIAIALNVLVLAATFGVLGFLFGSDHPLGGPGYIDPISAIGIATVVLGLSVDYEVFVLARVRERYDEADLTAATRYGLRSTRGVLTAAAIVTVAVAAAYARTDLVTVREFAIGVAVAVLIDAIVVRLVLLPIALRRLAPHGSSDSRELRPPPPAGPATASPKEA